MGWPRWLLWLFPFLKPRGTWADAVRVTDPQAVARLARCYADTVVWCRARGFPILAPACEVTFRVWPDDKRAPADFGIGKVLAPNVIAGDAHGTLLVRASLVAQESLLVHESKHCITGISYHPKDLFPNG